MPNFRIGKVIQLAIASTPHGDLPDVLYALTDEGHIFTRTSNNKEWSIVAPIRTTDLSNYV